MNKYQPENDVAPDVLKVDNSAVRAAQIDKLKRLRAERDEAQTQAALDALTRRRDSGRQSARARGRGGARQGERRRNLLSRWKKCSTAIKPKANVISGVYAREAGEDDSAVARVRGMTAAFEENERRKPRILVAKLGQDGHDRGQKVIASAFADLGFDVVIGDLFATPDEVAKRAAEEDVHIVGVSTMTAGHLTLTPELRDALKARRARRHHDGGRRRHPAAGFPGAL